MKLLARVPLLIDDLGMRKLPLIGADELLEIIMRCHERASTLITYNRPVKKTGQLLKAARGQVSTSKTSGAITLLLSFNKHLNCVWRNRQFDRQYCFSVWLEWRRNSDFPA